MRGIRPRWRAATATDACSRRTLNFFTALQAAVFDLESHAFHGRDREALEIAERTDGSGRSPTMAAWVYTILACRRPVIEIEGRRGARAAERAHRTRPPGRFPRHSCSRMRSSAVRAIGEGTFSTRASGSPRTCRRWVRDGPGQTGRSRVHVGAHRTALGRGAARADEAYASVQRAAHRVCRPPARSSSHALAELGDTEPGARALAGPDPRDGVGGRAPTSRPICSGAFGMSSCRRGVVGSSTTDAIAAELGAAAPRRLAGVS
jgi:hypothetical protein